MLLNVKYLLVVLADAWSVSLLFHPHFMHLVRSWDVLRFFLILDHLLDSFFLFKLLLASMSLIRVTL